MYRVKHRPSVREQVVSENGDILGWLLVLTRLAVLYHNATEGVSLNRRPVRIIIATPNTDNNYLGGKDVVTFV